MFLSACLQSSLMKNCWSQVQLPRGLMVLMHISTLAWPWQPAKNTERNRKMIIMLAARKGIDICHRKSEVKRLPR